jgi:hypothetical protein
VRTQAERLERLMAVGASELREVFARMLCDPLAVSVAGKVRAPAQAHLKSLAQAPASNPSNASKESSR